MGFVALLGKAGWETWLESKNVWGLYKHRFDKVPEVLRSALRYCLNQGFVVIAARNSEHFIQFRKYILRNGTHGLELGFPDANWSKVYFPKLRDALIADGLAFREIREFYGDVTAFIHVDCGQNIDRAVALARLCFFELFGLAPDTLFKSTLHDYSTVYDDVVDPDYANPSGGEWWSVWRSREQAKGRPDPASVMKFALFKLFWLLCYPALWVAWLVSDNGPSAWQLEIGPISLAGSHITWVLLLCYCALYAGTLATKRILDASIRRCTPRTRNPIDRLTALLATFGLPLAVIASWFGL